jgi:ATP-dependent RNA helicase DHX29
MRECTAVSSMALLLFGGPLTVLHEEKAVLLDGWLRIKASAQTAVLVKGLREAFDALLDQAIAAPEKGRGGKGGGGGLGEQGAMTAHVVEMIHGLLLDAEQQDQS